MTRLKSENGTKNLLTHILLEAKQLIEVIEDVHLFCCSFVKQEIDNEMSVDEVSAFDEEA